MLGNEKEHWIESWIQSCLLTSKEVNVPVVRETKKTTRDQRN